MNEVAGSSAEDALIGMGVSGESWRSAKPGSTKNAQKHTDNVTLGSLSRLHEKYYTIQPATAVSCLGSSRYAACSTKDQKYTRRAVSASHISLHIHQISYGTT